MASPMLRRHTVVMPEQLFVGGPANARAPGMPRREKFLAPKNGIHGIGIKPETGGLWTSTHCGDEGSGWIKWAVAEQWHSGSFESWLLDPVESSIIEVDTLDDAKGMFEEYAIEQPWEKTPAARELDAEIERAERLHRRRLGGGMSPREWFLRCLDFERMAADGVDGVHLTDAGQWATRHARPSLYGWDCECTLWLRWRFGEARWKGVAWPGEKGLRWDATPMAPRPRKKAGARA